MQVGNAHFFVQTYLNIGPIVSKLFTKAFSLIVLPKQKERGEDDYILIFVIMPILLQWPPNDSITRHEELLIHTNNFLHLKWEVGS
jgi:hypothetical protein